MDELYHLLETNQFQSLIDHLKDESFDQKHVLLMVVALSNLDENETLINYYEEHVDFIEDNYYLILEYYFKALAQLNEYDKLIDLLNEELSLPYLEAEVLEKITNLYDYYIKEKQDYLIENDIYQESFSDEYIIDALNNEQDFDLLMNIIVNLENYNVRKIIPNLKEFLADNEKNDILKSFILEILIMQQINDEFIVVKDNVSYQFNPINENLVLGDLNIIGVGHSLADELAKQPSFLEMADELNNIIAYIEYPKVLVESEVNLRTALITYYILSLNMEEVDDSLFEKYGVSSEDVLKQLSYVEANLKKSQQMGTV